MPFQPEQPIVPDRRGSVKIVFYIPDPDGPQFPGEAEVQWGQLKVEIKYSDGTTQERVYNLLVRLQDDAEGQTHLANLASLKAYIVSRIESELLP